MSRRTIVVVLALLSLHLGAPVLAAEPAPSDPPGSMALVLDASGSMAERVSGGGGTRIEAAREALSTVVDGLPDGQEVSMRVFGLDPDVAEDDPQACRDSEQVVAAGTDNRDDLRAAIGDYEPAGWTPTGYALQQAAKDLGNEGQRSIVLVSDGESTCDPDPCEVAEQLTADGIDVVIDVVGLDVEGKARDQLRCVAEKGNGRYVDARDADDITEGLVEAATRASRPFDLTGEPIEGTAEPAEAPEMSQGQYVDRIPVDGAVHYRVPRTIANSTIHVGVLHEAEPGSVGSGVRLSILEDSADARQCASQSTHSASLGESKPLQAGAADSWTSSPDDACNTSDSLLVSLERGSGEIGGLPIELAVYEEPPLGDTSGRSLDPAPEEPTWSPPTTDTAQDDVVPGTSIASAPVLEDGTYAFDITSGESQVVGVPLDWGQDLQAQLDADLDKDVLDAAGIGGGIEVTVLTPMRSTSQVSFYGTAPDDWTTTAFGNLWLELPDGGGTVPFRTGAQSRTVSYLNRDSTAPDVSGESMPGLHYVKVTFNVRDDASNVPYTLTLQRNGEAGEGAPEYAEVEGLTPPAADARLTSSSVREADPEESAEVASADAGMPVVPIALGAAGALALGAAGWMLVRRRG